MYLNLEIAYFEEKTFSNGILTFVFLGIMPQAGFKF